MSFIEIILIAAGLSMDSLAVSVTSGAILKECRIIHMIKIASVLAFFQAGMTVAGFMTGIGFRQYIAAFDHWIAFFILLYLGGKMIHEGKDEDGTSCSYNPLAMKKLCGLGFATSIDALAIGISIACLKGTIAFESFIIGIVTFIFSFTGVYTGHYCGKKLNSKLEVLGGVILIGIGLKILIEHLYLDK